MPFYRVRLANSTCIVCWCFAVPYSFLLQILPDKEVDDLIDTLVSSKQVERNFASGDAVMSYPLLVHSDSLSGCSSPASCLPLTSAESLSSAGSSAASSIPSSFDCSQTTLSSTDSEDHAAMNYSCVISPSDESQKVDFVRSFTFPQNYCPEVEASLREKSMTLKTSRLFYTSIARAMFALKRYPTRNEFDWIARRIVNKYKFLKSPLGDGHVRKQCKCCCIVLIPCHLFGIRATLLQF